jgi:hypothetical protein
LPNLIPNFKDLALKFDESELLSVCKTFLFKNLIDDNYSDNYIFFDCQSVVLQSLDCIAAEFANNNLLITPQILHSSVHPDEKQILNSGIFHAGFIGVNNSEESKKFINWWYTNTSKKGYRSLCKGLNQDQLWLELAPTLFEGVKIIKLDGLNIGKWNHLERMLNSNTKVDKKAVISYNFSHQKYPIEFNRQLIRYKNLNSTNQFGLRLPKNKPLQKTIARPFRFIAEQIDIFFDRF